MAATGLALLTGTGLGAWKVWHPGGVESASLMGGLDPHRIAVLYFGDENGRDTSRYLADGLTEGLIRELGQVPGLDVISKGGVAPYRGDSVSRDSVARALGAGTLVAGAVEHSADRVRVTVRLVDGPSGADFGRASVEQPAGDVLTIQDALTQKVANLIRERLGQEIRLREQRNRTRNPEAWALVQRAEQSRKQAEDLVQKKDTTGAVEKRLDQADSTYLLAHAADPKWAEPLVGRAWVAYRRSRLVNFDGVAAKPWIDKGQKSADDALALDPQDPDALEARGTLRYWKWILALEPDAAAAKKLLAEAQSDLETAVKIRPSQAGAWAMLSHLYNQTSGETDAKLAARRAYEADAYLGNADVIISRLYLASYDLGQFVDAAHWCDEGQRRFPDDFKFLRCQLWLMTSKAREPDVALAWKLADSLPKVVPAPERAYYRLEGQIATAAVLARAGFADSARHLLKRSQGGLDVDPDRELSVMEGFVYLLLGDKEDALKAVKSFLAANPARRAALADDPGWWYRSLQDDPRFQALVSAR
jgi:serine/threonine-protein kinase